MNCGALCRLAGFLNFSGTEAPGTDVDVAGSAADEGVDSMSVRKLSPFGHVVGMADLMGYLWPFAADLTPTLDSGHPRLLLIFDNAALRVQEILLNAP